MSPIIAPWRRACPLNAGIRRPRAGLWTLRAAILLAEPMQHERTTPTTAPVVAYRRDVEAWFLAARRAHVLRAVQVQRRRVRRLRAADHRRRVRADRAAVARLWRGGLTGG